MILTAEMNDEQVDFQSFEAYRLITHWAGPRWCLLL